MAITGASFDSGGSAGTASSKVTNSKTWVSGRLYIITVFTYLSTGGPATPTVTGSTQQGQKASLSALGLATVFTFLGDGTTGTKTIDCGGVTQTRIQYIIDEMLGTVITGTNASNAVVQLTSANGNSTTITATLAAFADATNNAAWFFAWNQGAAVMTIKAGYTALASDSSFFAIKSEFIVGQDLTPNMTQAANSWIGIAIELAALGGATSSLRYNSLLNGLGGSGSNFRNPLG